MRRDGLEHFTDLYDIRILRCLTAGQVDLLLSQ